MDYKDSIWNYLKDVEWMERVRKGLPRLIITCAITGGAHGRETTPNLPETPEQQAEETYKAYKAGASIVHVHARSPESGYSVSTTRTEDYYRINKLIRQACPDIIINNTTGGSSGMTMEQRIMSVLAKPELASLNCGPIAARLVLKARPAPLTGRDKDIEVDGATVDGWGSTEYFAKTMKENNVKPELEIYHPGQFGLVHNLIQKKLIDPPYMCQFVMGFQSGSYPTPMGVMEMLRGLPDDAIFQVIGVGIYQLPLTTLGIILGGHVRVGLEDNIFYKSHDLATNAQLVERVVRLSHELGREVATPAEARKIIGISEKPRQYP